MLARKQQPKALRSIFSVISLSLLASCSNSEAIESFVNADPQLQTEVNPENSHQNSTVNNSQNDREITPQSQNNQTNSDREILKSSNSEQITANVTSNSLLNLPEDIPEEIPLYPQAQLEQIEPELTADSGSIALRSQDNIRVIADYYQEQFQTQEWEIIQPFSLEKDGNSQTAIASKNNLKVKISLANSSIDSENNSSQTEITIAYKPFIPNLTRADSEPIPDLEVSPEVSEVSPDISEVAPEVSEVSPDTSEVAPEVSEVSPDTSEVSPEVSEVSPDTSEVASDITAVTDFSDLEEVPEQFLQAVKEVAALGILTPQTKNSPNKFAPNELVTRRDYARWLVSANNKYHDSSPGNKIHLAGKTDQIAFKDLDVNDPDFGEIQGLAEAGLIPSILTSDSNNVLFRPDATLTREDLVTWKVPLDVRAALPKASIESIEETWGFQDAAKIDPLAIKALFSDFQNGDRANVRRLFGYTTLFQPKKGVTRAEAAASLWYFGFQGDGISAEEILSLVDN